MAGPLEAGLGDVHYSWSRRHAPITEVAPGELVTVTTRDRFDGRLSEPVTAADLDERLYELVDVDQLGPLTGPIAVRGAKPGDVIRVGIVTLEPLGEGVSVIWPSWAEWDFIGRSRRRDFAGAHIRWVDLHGRNAGDVVELLPGFRIPLMPSLGLVGAAPASGEFAPWSASSFGGAVDVRELTAGTAIYLPVGCNGALVSVGGGRAAQADGAVATTALESRLRVTLVFELVDDMTLAQPRIETDTTMMTVASARTLDAAAHQALRLMLDVLIHERGLTPEDAYMLCSLAGDLRVSHVGGRDDVGVRMAIHRRHLAGTRHALASR